MSEATLFSHDYKVPVTMKIENSLVTRIQAMKNKCDQFDQNFSLTAIFVKAVELELSAKEKLCASADHTMM